MSGLRRSPPAATTAGPDDASDYPAEPGPNRQRKRAPGPRLKSWPRWRAQAPVGKESGFVGHLHRESTTNGIKPSIRELDLQADDAIAEAADQPTIAPFGYPGRRVSFEGNTILVAVAIQGFPLRIGELDPDVAVWHADVELEVLPFPEEQTRG